MLNFNKDELLNFIASLLKKKRSILLLTILSFAMTGNTQKTYDIYNFDVAGLKLKMPLSEAIILCLEKTAIADEKEFRTYISYGNKMLVQFIDADIESSGRDKKDLFYYNLIKHPMTKDQIVSSVLFKAEAYEIELTCTLEPEEIDPQEILYQIIYRSTDYNNDGIEESIRRDALEKYGQPSTKRNVWCATLNKVGNHCEYDTPILYVGTNSVRLLDKRLKLQSENFFKERQAEVTKNGF